MKKNVIVDKSFSFSVKIVNLVQDLKTNKRDYVISNQLLRSGTSICANVYEAQCAASRKDFNNKITIALKEANETHYWLKLLDNSYYSSENFKILIQECEEIIKILRSISLTMKQSFRSSNELK